MTNKENREGRLDSYRPDLFAAMSGLSALSAAEIAFFRAQLEAAVRFGLTAPYNEGTALLPDLLAGLDLLQKGHCLEGIALQELRFWYEALANHGPLPFRVEARSGLNRSVS